MFAQDRRIITCVDRVIQEAVENGIDRLSCNGCGEHDWHQARTCFACSTHAPVEHIASGACMRLSKGCVSLMALQVRELSLKHSCVTPNFGLHPWCAPHDLDYAGARHA